MINFPSISLRPARLLRRPVPLLVLLLAVVGLVAPGCQKAKPTTAVSAVASTYYTCSMHPQVVREEPGKCPICGMDLVKVTKRAAAPVAPAGAGSSSAVAPAPAPAEVMLSGQQQQLANIQVATLGAGPQQRSTLLTGTVVANANQTRTVSSRVNGRVERLYVRQTGEPIRQGAPLVALYSEELQALQQEYLLGLAQQRAVGRTNSFDRLVEAARQKLQLLGLSNGQLRTLAATGRPTPALTFYSPQAGLVQAVGVTEGQYVSAGTLLVSLTNLSSLWVEAQLYPDEVAGIRLGQTVQVRVAGFSEEYTGRVIFLSPELQANSKVTLLRVQLANPGGHLQPGMQANVDLTSPRTAALVLPQAAVLRDSRGSYVWQQTAPGRFHRAQVTTGPETDLTVAITGGLAAGAQVVVSGAYLLESEYALYQGGGMDPNMPGMEKKPAMDPNMKM